MEPSPHWLRPRVAVLGVALVLYTAVFVLTVTIDSTVVAVSSLFVVPVVLAATQLDFRGGLLAGLLALALIGAWDAVAATKLGVAGVLSRGLALVVVGAVVGWFAGSLRRSLSEAEEYAAALSWEAKRFRMLATLAPVGIFHVDGSGAATFVNRRWEEISGVSAEDAARDGWRHAVHPDDRVRLAAEWQEASRDRLPFETEVRHLHPDERVTVAVVKAEPITGTGDDDGGYLGTLLDVTERHGVAAQLSLAHEELERKAVELERSNQQLEDFAYAAAHELMDPLGVIRTYVEILEQRLRDRLSLPERRYLENLEKGTSMMQALLDSLLALARLQSEPHVVTAVDARVLAGEVVADLFVEVERLGARVSVEGLPRRVPADRTGLLIAFHNLLANALKYHGDNPPSIELRAAREGDAWRFSVRDNGLGIDPAERERVFDMFSRLRPGAQSGSGVGLAITKRIVEQHGGRIWVDPVAGGGSEFNFTLPAQEQPA